MLMNEKEKKIVFLVFFLLALALIFAIGDALWQRGTVRELRWQLEHRDTTKVTEVRTDTIHDTIPKIAEEKQVGVLKVPANDILRMHRPSYFAENVDIKQKEVENSAYDMMQPTAIDTIELPRMQRTYKDSTYTAWVSGYDPKLDSIEVYHKTIKETVTIAIPAEKRRRTFWQRFNIGVQAGYGLGLDDKKAHPYVGCGIGFNL